MFHFFVNMCRQIVCLTSLSRKFTVYSLLFTVILRHNIALKYKRIINTQYTIHLNMDMASYSIWMGKKNCLIF